MKRKKLTDTYIRTRKPAPRGQRDETMDTDHPRVGLRVTDRGHRSFFYLARFPGSSNPTRRALGDYPTTTLAEAHKKARQWDDLLAKGVDPRDEDRRLDAEAEKARKASTENTFALRAPQYLAFAKDQRQLRETTRIINKELLPAWRDRPLASISSRDVKDVIGAIAARSNSMARNVLTVAKSFFDWALEQEHVDISPAAGIRPQKLIGKKVPRQRLLSDDEIKAFWKATETLGYPYRDLYRLLLLTGVRLREAAEARWDEIDLKKKIWTVPPERFKSDTTHLVPLSDSVVQLLNELPRFREGNYLFSHDCGRHPVNSFSKSKARVDLAMTDELHTLKPWVVHDLRRVVRSKLASLKVADLVAELILGHGKKGVQRIYDLEKREPEMREALELWAGKVRDIVTPPPENLLKLKKRKAV